MFLFFMAHIFTVLVQSHFSQEPYLRRCLTQMEWVTIDEYSGARSSSRWILWTSRLSMSLWQSSARDKRDFKALTYTPTADFTSRPLGFEDQHVLPVHPAEEPGPPAEPHLHGGGRSIQRPLPAHHPAPPAQRAENCHRGGPAPSPPPHLPPSLWQPLDLPLLIRQPDQDPAGAQQPQSRQLRQVCGARSPEGPEAEEAGCGLVVCGQHPGGQEAGGRRRGAAEDYANQSEDGGHVDVPHLHVPQTSAGLQQQRWDLHVLHPCNWTMPYPVYNCYEVTSSKHKSKPVAFVWLTEASPLMWWISCVMTNTFPGKHIHNKSTALAEEYLV